MTAMTSASYPIPSPSPSPTPPSPSPTRSSSGFLYSPTKPPRNQPNAHPYAIKTTSTALLSRSTSTTSASAMSMHHYVPSSPSPTDPPRSPVKVHKPSRHRYSRSLTSDFPAPLPPPPTATHAHTHSPSASGGDADLEDDTPTRRRRDRAETMPSAALAFPSANYNAIHPDLPGDPKMWTPTQLGVYLASSGESGVVGYVQERQISGHVFMRLAESDLENLPAAQRSSLLSASRALRQRVMRGRIFGPSTASDQTQTSQGFNSPFSDEPEENQNENQNDHENPLNTTFVGGANITRRNGIHIRPGRRSRHSSLASDSSDSSASSISSASSSTGGRVRDMVDEFESRMDEEGTADSAYSSSPFGEERERRGSRSPVKRRGEPSFHTRYGAQAQGASASPTPTKLPAQGHIHAHAHPHGQQQQQHRLPQRAAVTDLFGFNGTGSGLPPASISPTAFATISASGPGAGPSSSLGPGSSPGSGMPTPETRELEEKDNTITQLARKNVNGREARLLPFPPSSAPPQAQGQGWVTPMHTGTQYALPSSPDSSLGLAYAHANQPHGHYVYPHHELPHHLQQQAYNQAYTQLPPPADYELGFRNAVSPSTSAATPSTITPGLTPGPSPHFADPHSQTYIVQHNPASPSNSNGSGDGSLTAKGRHGGSKGHQRLLPYPPVVGQGVLHHPRPRRVIGVGAGGGGGGEETTGADADEESVGGEGGGGWLQVPIRDRAGGSDAGSATTTETENEAWETATEGPALSSTSDDDDQGREEDEDRVREKEVREEEEEEERTVEELLRANGAYDAGGGAAVAVASERRSHKGHPHAYAPISGVEAWEMELGETVKRISSNAAAASGSAHFSSISNASSGSASISASASASVHLQSNAHFGVDAKAKHAGAGAGTTARDAPEIGRRAGRATGGTNRDRGSVIGTGRENFGTGTRRAGILGLFDPPPALAPSVPAAEEDVKEDFEGKAKEIKMEEEVESPPPVPEKEEKDVVKPLDIPEKEDTAKIDDVGDDQDQEPEQDQDQEVSSRAHALADLLDLNLRESELAVREKALESREESVQRQHAVLADDKADMTSLKRALDERVAEMGQREVVLSEREEVLRRREVDVERKEVEVERREKVVQERERAVQEKERVVEEREAALARAQVQAQVAAETSVRDEAPEASEGPPSKGGDAAVLEMEDLNPTRPKPYLASPWAIKRDYMLGRFMGLFPLPLALFGVPGAPSVASASSSTSVASGSSPTSASGPSTTSNGDASASTTATSTRRRGSILNLLNFNLKNLTALAGQSGGYVVLMSLGVCAVVLRVLGRRWVGAAAGAGARGVGRR